jgi:hypothetical protein
MREIIAALVGSIAATKGGNERHLKGGELPRGGRFLAIRSHGESSAP